MLAQFEAGTNRLDVGHFEAVAGFGQLTKVQVSKAHFGHKLKAEGQVGGLQLPGLSHVFGLKISQQLPHIETRLAVVSAVVDAHLRVIAVGNGLLEAQQASLLRLIAPHRITATRTRRMHVGRGLQVLHVVA